MTRLADVEISGGIRYRILHQSKDVTSEVFLTDGKSSPFGWSQYKLVHRETVAPGCEDDVDIGWLYCGEPKLTKEGYTWEKVTT